MKGGWVTVDTKEFLSSRGERRVRDHAMTKKLLAWVYCAHCGLLSLRNEATRRAMREKCVTYE